MKICLINPRHEESLDPNLDVPLGILYIATILKNINYDVMVLDLSFYDRNIWESVIPYADIYGITILTASFHRSMIIRDICKKINPKSKIIAGGAHSSALPEETSKEFDIVCVGDGEGIIQDIIKYIEINNDSNLAFPKIFDGNKKLMDINEIPFPARELVPIEKYTRLVNGDKATSIITSRGCIYRCSFCQNSMRKEKVRFRTIDNIIREIKELILKYNYKTLIFYDDNITTRPDFVQLLKEIKKLNIIFRCNGDARKNNKELFQKLYDSGCREICFGIESGSQKILDKINKKVTVEQNRIAIIEAKKAGLNVKAFLILGSPGESWDTVKETVEFMQKTRPQYWTLFQLIPLPGCELYENPEKYGIKIITKDWRQYYNIAGQNEGGLVCETEFMTIEELAKARQYVIRNLPGQSGPLQDYYKKLNK